MRRREHTLQVVVAHMLDIVLDPARTWWSAIDHGVGKLGKAEAGIRKARGVKAGLPDIIILPMCDRALGIELKIDVGRLSPAQIELRDDWVAMGHRYYVARSLEDVQEILDICRVPMRSRITMFGGAHDRAPRSAAARHPRARRRRKSEDDLSLVLIDQAQIK